MVVNFYILRERIALIYIYLYVHISFELCEAFRNAALG